MPSLTQSPFFTVLMPVKWPAPFLDDAIESVVQQTFQDWELVLVNDGAADEVVDIALRKVPEERLVVVTIPESKGLPHALNCGLQRASGIVVARLDADDVAEPKRLEVQAEFLKRNPHVSLVGSSAHLIDEEGIRRGVRLARTKGVRRSLVLRNQFVHSSVAFRRAVILEAGGYNESCHLREDYELWLRLARTGGVANIRQPLVSYRISPGQISRALPGAEVLRLVEVAQQGLADAIGLPSWAAWVGQRLWRRRQTRTWKLPPRRKVESPNGMDRAATHKANSTVVKKILSMGLAEVDRIGQELDLDYILIAGSALGARRDGEIISWDDDIDIAMTQESFDRWTKFAGAKLSSAFQSHSRKDDPVLGAQGKVYANGTRLLGTFGDAHGLVAPLHPGAFIDIFVLYRAAPSRVWRRVEWFAGWLVYVRPWARGMARSDGDVPLAARAGFLVAGLIPHGWIRILEAWLWRRSARRSDELLGIGPGGVNGVCFYPGEEVFPRVRTRFAAISSWVPADLDSFLTRTYGPDFLAPPPFAARAGHAGEIDIADWWHER